MFGRTKTPPAPAPVERPAKDGGKNRPTPKRSVSQAANRRPLVASDRRGATAASRTAARDERRRVLAARMDGDERYLATRDRGPVRRYLRDLVDARHNAGDYFLVFILAVFVVQLVAGTISLAVGAASYALLWVGIAVVLVDGLRLRALVRRRVPERFGPDVDLRGLTSYAVMRSLQLRRGRAPRPAVRRGEQPR